MIETVLAGAEKIPSQLFHGECFPPSSNLSSNFWAEALGFDTPHALGCSPALDQEHGSHQSAPQEMPAPGGSALGFVPTVPLPQPAPVPFELFSCNTQLFLCSSACKDPCKPPACSELSRINTGAARTTGISHRRDLSQVFYLMPFSEDICT